MLRKLLPSCVLLSALIVLCGAPVGAQLTPARAGIDLWKTDNPSLIDFSDNPAPQNFFGCGETFAGTIAVKGKPIAASQNLGMTDTILRRTADINFDAAGNGTTGLVIEALCLRSVNTVTICGQCWTVQVRLPAGPPQTVGWLAAHASSNAGGTFTSDFVVNAEVLFFDGSGAYYGSLPDQIRLRTTSGTWQRTPAAGGATATTPITVDRNCNNVLDASDPALPGTSNFFPVIVTHDGPHSVSPPSTQCEDVVVVGGGRTGATRLPAGDLANTTFAGDVVYVPGDVIDPVPVPVTYRCPEAPASCQ